MENYYENLELPDVMNVYPVLNGFYFWEYNEDCSFLYEMSNNVKYLRIGYDYSGKLLSDTTLKQNRKFQNSRLCTKSQVIDVLKKMDFTCYDGCCLIRYDDNIRIIDSFQYKQAKIQYKNWLIEQIHNFKSIEELQEFLKSHVDTQICKFVCQEFFYILSDFYINQDFKILEKLINI